MSRKQLPWFALVQPGDVVRTRSGDMRVVRAVGRFPNGDLGSLTFVIRRCSWTRRPYTVVNYTDLRMQGYEYVGITVPLDPEFQQRLQMDTCEYGKLDCCDVKGIP